jgi:hypothetical protein
LSVPGRADDGKSLDVAVAGFDTEKFARVSDDASATASPDNSQPRLLADAGSPV